MAKRALIVGSQTGGLRGVHSDVEVVDDALTSLGFTVTRAIEGDASRDGIVERYRGLIEDTTSADAAVVYYSGHGGRQRNALAASDPTAPRWLHFIVPTDIDDRSSDTFRGVLAQELSLLQLELSEKTENVTTILDCCHSARMSRDAATLPKADGQLAAFPWADLERRWSRVRSDASGGAAIGDDNPTAVRLVACSPDQSAYELADTTLGGPHGALTSTLVPILKSATAGLLTWRGLLDLVRPAVVDIVPQQRPELEGPLNRFLFATEQRDETGVLPVRVAGGVALLDGAAVFGMAEGDTYAVVGPGGDPRRPLATAVVDRIIGDAARLLLHGVTADGLPSGASAHPTAVALGARPVAVVPTDHPDRSLVVEALRGSPHVRVVEPTVAAVGAGVLATVRLDEDGLLVLDAVGEALHEAPKLVSDGTLALLANDLQTLARATHVRELASGAGRAALPHDVDVSYTRQLAGGGEAHLSRSGEHLFSGDRVVVRFHNRSSETRYVSVLDVGISGAVSLQTTAEPDGVTLESNESYELGRNAAGVLEGIELFWPPAVPATAPRPETFVTIVSDAKVNGLRRLEQAGVKARGAADDKPVSALERLVADLDTGRRDARPAEAEVRPTRYRVDWFDFVFHPVERGGDDKEPTFEVDERPDPSFRLVVPRSATRVPERVAVRLKELTVHSNRSLLSSTVRVDALVVTAPPEGSGEPYRAVTSRFDRVKDGDRLPFDDLLVYEGPVGRFVDLAVWVAKDDQRELDLADLLAREAGSHEVKGAVAVLAGLGLAAPHAAVVAGSAAAVATLVRTGARLLDAVQGKSIGIYRTSLLPHQRFGAGSEPPGAARHPAQGLVEAQDMSFAFEVVDLDLA
ncbi:MAG: caspase family protein [Actinomycetota bacterium]|nr:caspase family protein [Actinomycetota bacterium]